MKKILFFIFGLFVSQTVSVYAYSDVNSSTEYNRAIGYITDLGIVEGYEDGTFKPENPINRAEFTKILVEAKNGQEPEGYTEECFNDFPADRWFTSYVCYAKAEGIISGYPEGGFGPANNINLAEASKILVNVFDIKQVNPQGEEWYSVYVETLGAQGYIPKSFEYINDEVTRAEMAEMIYRIMEEIHDLPFVAAVNLENSPCQPLGEDLPDNIDMDIVRQTWIDWYNTERNALALHSYVYNDQLNRTATLWSEISEDRGYIDHKRPGQTSYYDYYMIKDWFEGLGVTFKDGMYTENIAWEMYYCSAEEEDCTQDMIDAIKKGFNFFMSEKGTGYTAHYDSIMSPVYNEIGLGIAVDESANKYYLTVHYAKGITSNPMRICE